MSNVHAYMDPCDRMAPASARTAMEAIDSLRIATAGRLARLFASVEHRRTMQRIAGLLDHRLHNMGFERAWDGSTNRMPR